MVKKSDAGVPAFKLYGETASWPTPDLMHCESIPERSKLHDWEIKAHRHVDLMQLLYVQRGHAVLKVEETIVHVDRPMLQVVPAMNIHTFKFSQDIQGHILTFAQPLLQELSSALEGAYLYKNGCYDVGEDAAHLDMLFNSISIEYRQKRPGRQLTLHSLISLLMVWILRKNSEEAQSCLNTTERSLIHLQGFVSMLEHRYQEHWSISRYASALGISANHLNALCRRLGGQSALQMINERLSLEAKRCLIYTEMTINQISDSLGFSDPAYFSRFFKRSCGVSPKAFRSAR
ncbi:helix-turn-helix domain-containing protein [Pseudomonas sp.]|uniref:helix-turn-helix domain-containing protein n=1 Tax=Pseudomonas sp. TaxID=306 RepID=UPI00263572A4|nr:helix-turn-helix domain-containing protein [Pseudomonas sp.]